jgi:GntR family transcriptional regulator
MINRNIPIPLYYQVMQEIKNKIESGELKPGDAIQKELELKELYDISRATIRQAILQLVNEGYLRRLKAKGTFVCSLPEKPKFMGTLKGFAREMEEKGIPYSTIVLEKRYIPTPVKIAENLQVAEGSNVFQLKRLRYIQDEPVLISESYIPEKYCPGILDIDFEKKSLYDVLKQKYNIFLHHGTRYFEAVIAYSVEDMKLLKISSKTPLLKVIGLVYTQEGLPIEYVEIKYRGKFTVNLVQV